MELQKGNSSSRNTGQDQCGSRDEPAVVAAAPLTFKGTPGPWTREINAQRGAWIANANGQWSALACGEHSDEADANADLIAAAPELLDVLQALLRNDCPIWGADPFGAAVVEYWTGEKAQGRGDADLYLRALAATSRALGSAA